MIYLFTYHYLSDFYKKTIYYLNNICFFGTVIENNSISGNRKAYRVGKILKNHIS
jgi:hypothetical protein